MNIFSKFIETSPVIVRLLRDNNSALLRLGSAALGFAIILLIALAYDSGGEEELREFFYTSLVGVVVGGFTSFTLTRHSSEGLIWSATCCAISSSLIFVAIDELLLGGALNVGGAIIAFGFFLREILSYYLRSTAHFSNAVLVREYFWRFFLILALIWSITFDLQANLLTNFIIATVLAIFAEIIFTIRRVNIHFSRHFASERNFFRSSISIAAFDLVGKMQSLAIAFFPIYVTSIADGVDAAQIVLFILCERAARPLGMILSQGLLDFQVQGLKLGRLREYCERFIRTRKLQLLIGIFLSSASLAVMLLAYDTNPSLLEMALTLLFFTYVIFFNLTTSHSVLNHKLAITFLRASLVMLGIYSLNQIAGLTYSHMVALALSVLVSVDVIFLAFGTRFARRFHV